MKLWNTVTLMLRNSVIITEFFQKLRNSVFSRTGIIFIEVIIIIKSFYLLFIILLLFIFYYYIYFSIFQLVTNCWLVGSF